MEKEETRGNEYKQGYQREEKRINIGTLERKKGKWRERKRKER